MWQSCIINLTCCNADLLLWVRLKQFKITRTDWLFPLSLNKWLAYHTHALNQSVNYNTAL